MQYTKTLLVASLLLSSKTIFAQDAAELFKQKCSTCHTLSRPSDVSTLVAPPVQGVMRHVKMKYPSKDEAIGFIVDYVLDPSADKAVCMPQKIARFGLMPSQKGKVSILELKTIAGWMYDHFPSSQFHGGMKGKNGNCMRMRGQK